MVAESNHSLEHAIIGGASAMVVAIFTMSGGAYSSGRLTPFTKSESASSVSMFLTCKVLMLVSSAAELVSRVVMMSLPLCPFGMKLEIPQLRSSALSMTTNHSASRPLLR